MYRYLIDKLFSEWIRGFVSKETAALRRWGVETNVWLSIELITKDKLPPLRDSSADVSSVSPSSEVIVRNVSSRISLRWPIYL